MLAPVLLLLLLLLFAGLLCVVLMNARPISRRVLVGTLESLRPARAAVRVTVYALD